MRVLETERLVLRWLTNDDAEFILTLVNEPAWKLHTGDNGIRALEDAVKYIEKLTSMYTRLGFGLYLVELKETGRAVGICGLIKRESLEDVDIGYALLREFWSNGCALESAKAVLAWGQNKFQLARVVAISSKNNDASAKLLAKLGFRLERMTKLKVDGDEVKLYAIGP
jgi:RimJ/RimL family protein N-acetyltransferase